MKKADDTNFDTVVLAADKPVLVDFSATWCAPCRMLKPILEKFADAHTEIDVVYVDADASPASSARYNVTALPTLMVFDKGKVKATTMGLQNEARLTSFVSGAIG